MKILLTGGSGDMGGILARQLLDQNDDVVILDIAPPHESLKGRAGFVKGSIIDREAVKQAMQDVDCVAHIAAWHGIHEQQGKTAYDFHDLNVTGTMNVLQAAADAGVKKFVLISSTSVDDRYGMYGHTKVLNEEMARAYAVRHDMDVLTLRPRAFIPPWNRGVYARFTDWANWFVKGAVHISDVCQAALKEVNFLKTNKPNTPAPTLTIDGAYEIKTSDLESFSRDILLKYYDAADLDCAEQVGIDITRQPKILGSQDAEDLIGYRAEYSLKNMLADFKKYGEAGPPHPLAQSKAQAKPPKPS